MPILPLGRTSQGFRHTHRAERMGDHNTDEFLRRDFLDRLLEIMGDAGIGEKEIDAAPIEASAHERARPRPKPRTVATTDPSRVRFS